MSVCVCAAIGCTLCQSEQCKCVLVCVCFVVLLYAVY